MSLFASMAGSCIELTPIDRLRNVLQCSPITSSEVGESIYCYRFLPVDTSADYLSELVGEIILNYPLVKVGQAGEFSRPLSQQELSCVREELAKRHSVIETLNKDYVARLAT
jgi:hypothetical protein